MAIIFFIIGGAISSFTLVSALICLIFGIPTTKKLQQANLLVENNSIIRRYLISICILSIIFVVVLCVVYFIDPTSALRGFIGGSVFVIIISIGKLRGNTNNISDYISTQSRYFNKPVEFILGFLNSNK